MARIYQGRVFSGIGVASTRVRQNAALYNQVCGVDLVPGTLNVALTEEFQIPPGATYLSPDQIQPVEKNRGIIFVPAKLGGEKVFVIIPDNSIYDGKVIEIMAAFNIREKFGLGNGDMVQIQV